MSSLLTAWQRLEARLNGMAPRERFSVLAAVVLVILFLWYQLMAAPHWQRMDVEREQTQRMMQQGELLNAQLGPLEQRLAEDPNRLLKEQNRQLLIQLEQQERSLQERLERLVKPEEMAALLEQLLKQNAGLQVVSIEKLPAIPVLAAEKLAGDAAPALYRHGLRMVFEGGYFDTLVYLKRLEGLDKAVLFNNLQFQVIDYPGSRVVLEVETLSLEKGWMGV